MNFFKLFLLITFLTLNLFAFGMSGSGGGGGGSDDDETKQFDTWDYWIGDDKKPPDSDDRTISTKIAGKAFQISLASIDKDDTKYEKKKKDSNANKDYSIEIAIYKNDSATKTRVSNIIKFDPTSDDDKYINKSDEITVEEAYRDLVVGIRMCASYDEDKEEYVIYEMSECSGQDNDCTNDSDDEEFKMCYATNNFSVRPKKFNITEKTTLLTAGEDQGFDVIAEDEDGNATQKYTLPEDNTDGDVSAIISAIIDFFASSGDDTGDEDYDLNLTVIKYMPDESVNDELYGEGHIVEYKFKDGDATGDDRNISINYNEVGKVTLIPKDLNWTNVDYDDTDDNCNNGDDDPEEVGRFICGDTNATFIPSYFLVSEASLHNHNDLGFTYISDDENMSKMSAHIALKIEAKNFDDNTTKNFDIDSWENNITVSFITDNEIDINKSNAGGLDLKLGFNEGNKTILWNDENSSLNLMFNYKRDINESRNPFIIESADFNFTIISIYNEDTNITDSNGDDIEIDGNITFLYARTNVPRSRFIESDTYNVNLYYESFCYATDKYNNDCNRSLLPDGIDSNITNDPRWFINTKHNHTDNIFGKAEKVKEIKGRTFVETEEQPTGDHQDSVTLKYEKKIFPYKTTMQNNASSWLIYRKYDATAKTNEFEVEFNKKSGESGWIGVSEEDVANTKSVDTTTRTNRRTMW